MSEYFKKPIVKTLMLKGQEGQSIKGIKKTGTSGLKDTYTITLTDGTTSTFAVTNGKGISSISKTGTDGLVDTYTTTYNDGTTSTFTVTNGEGLQNLQVGGRNILKGTKDFSGFTIVGGSQKVLDSDGFYYCNITDSFSNYFHQTIDKNILHLDVPYVISFYAKADSNAVLQVKEDSENNYELFSAIINSAEWKKYSGVTTFPSSKTLLNPIVSFISRQSTTQVYIKEIKLELGNTPTDWTPAPEDLETTAITNAEIDTIIMS